MKISSRNLLTFFAVFFLFGCAAKQMVTLPAFEAKQFNKTMYTSKTDNFLILFDASSSMSESGKFEVAQALVARMNQTLPELGQTAGLRSFGHSPNLSKKLTELFYGMEPYVSGNLENNLGNITEPGGSSPLYAAIDAAGTDLNGFSNDLNAVIIITDGLDMKKDALASAKALKERYGSSICFYPVLVGDSAEGEALLQEINAIGECGFYSTADELLTSAGMANFVEQAFLAKKAVPVAPVVKVAPPVKPVAPMKKDSDHDGVYDDEDQCPGTPIGATVNAVGCWVLDKVLFDTNKAEIKAQAHPMLDNLVEILEKNPGMGIEIHGHCDKTGTHKYNMVLSMRRADAVKQYLTGKGILENRMVAKGFGFTKPIAPNDTPEGRSMNRRVEIHPY